jgi:hypothetical protein
MPRSRRSHNRIDGDRLYDDAGNEWHRIRTDLSRAAIARLLADPEVPVGVHAGRAMLRWIPIDDRERVWTSEIEPHFHDRADDGPRTDALTQPPFHGTEWRRRGQHMLLFDDFD